MRKKQRKGEVWPFWPMYFAIRSGGKTSLMLSERDASDDLHGSGIPAFSLGADGPSGKVALLTHRDPDLDSYFVQIFIDQHRVYP